MTPRTPRTTTASFRVTADMCAIADWARHDFLTAARRTRGRLDGMATRKCSRPFGGAANAFISFAMMRSAALWTSTLKPPQPELPASRSEINLRSFCDGTHLIIFVSAVAAVLGATGCTRQPSPQPGPQHVPTSGATAASPERSHPVEAPGKVAATEIDPLAERRGQLVERIQTLRDAECDNLVLQLQLIPRDEILEPLSKPRNELLRYVRRIASEEDLNRVERAMNDRR